MKSEKEKLAAKSVEQLKASYKRMGGKLVNVDGKAKTKVDLINGIVMKQRLAGKTMGGNAATKKTTVKAKPGNTTELKRIVAAQKKLDALYKALSGRIAKALKK